MSISKQVAVKWGFDTVVVSAFSSSSDCVLFGFESGGLNAAIAGTPAGMRAIAAMLNSVADEVEGRRSDEPSRAVVAALADEMEPE